MPIAVALLCHPLGIFTALVAAVVATLFAVQSHRFVPSFTAAAAALLTVLAFLQAPPTAAPLGWLVLGIALLHIEFLRPTFGIAGVLGLAATMWGSCGVLASAPIFARGAAALLGTCIIAAAVARTMRLRTLPRPIDRQA